MKTLALVVAVLCFALALLVALVGAHVKPEDFEYAGLTAFALSFLLP